MKISICIPHYNRIEYLIKVLNSIENQTYREIEVVISDDCSIDNSEKIIKDYIKRIEELGDKIKFKYLRQQKNIGYDANLRMSLANGSGDYLFTLGNDDCLSNDTSVEELVRCIKKFNTPELLYCNYYETSVNSVYTRTRESRIMGIGPFLAARVFRNFSFVGGIAIKRTSFLEYNTPEFDGSIFFQIYLATKIISEGGVLATINNVLVTKDIQIDGKYAESFLDKLKRTKVKLKPVTNGLERVFLLAYRGIEKKIEYKEKNKIVRMLYSQLLIYTYPFWLVYYRKNKIPLYSINLALGYRPANFVKIKLSFFNLIHLYLLYIFTTLGGLLIPVKLFDKATMKLRSLSKKNVI